MLVRKAVVDIHQIAMKEMVYVVVVAVGEQMNKNVVNIVMEN